MVREVPHRGQAVLAFKPRRRSGAVNGGQRRHKSRQEPIYWQGLVQHIPLQSSLTGKIALILQDGQKGSKWVGFDFPCRTAIAEKVAFFKKSGADAPFFGVLGASGAHFWGASLKFGVPPGTPCRSEGGSTREHGCRVQYGVASPGGQHHVRAALA